MFSEAEASLGSWAKRTW